MSVFKSYDIRGVYRKEWDRESAYKIGFFLPALLNAHNILVGRDARESSEEIFEALSLGIREADCDVTDIGLCSTPSLYFATARFRFAGSVMITASHNPPEYNGLKISRKDAVPVGYETGLNELERMVSGKIIPAGKKGVFHTLDIRKEYLAHLEPFMLGTDKVRAVVDCSDGMASVFIHDVIKRLKAEVTTMYDRADGRFPHHPPNPLVEENLNDLKKRTLAEKADLGICFDGDADRVMFVDEKGRFISPDLITALLGLYFFKDTGKGEVVTYDVRSSRSVVDFIRRLGGTPVICKVGHSHAKKLLRERKGIFGGELAGHYYFRDNYYCDSGMIAALIVLSVLSGEKVPLSRLIKRIKKYHFSGEINFHVRDKDRLIHSILADYRDGSLTDIDGIRLDFPGWWFNLRKSNTEPYLRLVVEAETKKELKSRTGELTARIEALDSLQAI